MDATNCERCDVHVEDTDEGKLFFCQYCMRYLCMPCFGDVAEHICDDCLEAIEVNDDER